MSDKLLVKVLGAVLVACGIVIWWFAQMQVTTNIDTDKRIDDLTTQVQTLRDWRDSQTTQTQRIWQRLQEVGK